MSKSHEFSNVICDENFFYHVSMPRTATNYMVSLLEVFFKRPRFDIQNATPTSYLSDKEKLNDPIFYNTHESFWKPDPYGCRFDFSDNSHVIAPVDKFRKVVVQIRNPIDVLYSLNQLGIGATINNYNDFINKWCFDFNPHQRIYDNRFIFVYEEFLFNQEQTISNLLEFLNMTFTNEEVSSVLQYVGDRKKYFSHVNSNEKHLKNTHTLSDSYRIGRDNYRELNKGICKNISVKTLRDFYDKS